MNKKLVYIILGIVMGILISGSIGLAKNIIIEVEQRSLNYSFNGEQKTPAAGEEGFIYNSRTYVPIRFISEALGKDVAWNGEEESISINDRVIEDTNNANNSDAINTPTSNANDTAEEKFIFENKKIYTVDASDNRDKGKTLEELKNFANLLTEVNCIDKANIQIIGIYKELSFLRIPCYNPETSVYYDAIYKYNLKDDTFDIIDNIEVKANRKKDFIASNNLIINIYDTSRIYNLDTMQMLEVDIGSYGHATADNDFVFFIRKEDYSDDFALYRQKFGQEKAVEIARLGIIGTLRIYNNYIYCYGNHDFDGSIRRNLLQRYNSAYALALVENIAVRISLDGTDKKSVGMLDILGFGEDKK